MPDYQKATGIGDYVTSSKGVAPNTYYPEGFLDQIEQKKKQETNAKTAVKQWQQRIHKDAVDKHPEKYGITNPKKPLPGPAHYAYENSQYYRKGRNFQKAGQSAFNVGEDKVVTKYDKTQLHTMENPGAGSYNVLAKPMPKRQQYTSNMMSATQKMPNGQRLHSVDYPSATAYNSCNFDTIENPMVTGGAPNNILKLAEYEQKIKQKQMNPFATNEQSFKQRMEVAEGHLGPGRYSPQTRADFGGSEFQRSRNAFMLSTLTGSGQKGSREKVSATQIREDKMASSGALSEFNGDGYKTMGQTSFGSQTERFRTVNQELKKQLQLPGPGKYYSFGAGNVSPRAGAPNNDPFNDSR